MLRLAEPEQLEQGGVSFFNFFLLAVAGPFFLLNALALEARGYPKCLFFFTASAMTKKLWGLHYGGSQQEQSKKKTASHLLYKGAKT